METTTIRTVISGDQRIQYYLERKDVKNLNLRIRNNGDVYVSAKDTVPTKEIDDFVSGKSAYILKSIMSFNELAKYKPQPKVFVSGETFYILGRGQTLRVQKSEKENVSSDGVHIFLSVKDTENYERKKQLMKRFLNKQCRLVFNGIVGEVYPVFKKYDIEYPVLRIRDMETRWGSCLAKKGIITLNKRLLEAPRICIEYVVTHEFCHFIHPNHSAQFYNFLTMLMPDWKERKALLEKTAVYRL